MGGLDHRGLCAARVGHHPSLCALRTSYHDEVRTADPTISPIPLSQVCTHRLLPSSSAPPSRVSAPLPSTVAGCRSRPPLLHLLARRGGPRSPAEGDRVNVAGKPMRKRPRGRGGCTYVRRGLGRCVAVTVAERGRGGCGYGYFERRINCADSLMLAFFLYWYFHPSHY